MDTVGKHQSRSDDDGSSYFPTIINIVRSSFYTPNHLLDYIECEVFKGFVRTGSSTSSTNNNTHANNTSRNSSNTTPPDDDDTDNSSSTENNQNHGIFGHGLGIYYSNEVDINRTIYNSGNSGNEEKGCIGHTFFPTPILRSNTGRNIYIDPVNIDTDIDIYNSFFGWKEEVDNDNNKEVEDDDIEDQDPDPDEEEEEEEDEL